MEGWGGGRVEGFAHIFKLMAKILNFMQNLNKCVKIFFLESVWSF
jgi:hypothetical protein